MLASTTPADDDDKQQEQQEPQEKQEQQEQQEQAQPHQLASTPSEFLIATTNCTGEKSRSKTIGEQ